MKDKCSIEFVGLSSQEVTQSINLIKFRNSEILVDCGGRQSTDDEDDYKVNSKWNKELKPRKINAVVLTHSHIDHTMLVAKLVKDGFNGPVYIPKGMKGLLTIMLQDCVKIMYEDYERFKRKPLYTQENVDKVLSLVIEVPIHTKIQINSDIAFTYYNAQHIVKARQVLLEINDGINVKKIGVTGDISNYNSYYLNDFESLPRVDVLIGECTYGGKTRVTKAKDRKKDMEKIETAVSDVLETRSKILIPTFSLDRLQIILTFLYEMYKDNPKIKIVVNTPLGQNISEEWNNVIDKNYELWEKVHNWENVIWESSYTEMQNRAKSKEPVIILASGGFMNGGTSMFWTKELLGNKNNYIIFGGYSSPDSLAGQIKAGLITKVTIDKKTVPSKANIMNLNSFSAHMDNDQLLKYYTTIDYEKIYLVHGNLAKKKEFAKTLKEALQKKDKTSKVVSTDRFMKALI